MNEQVGPSGTSISSRAAFVVAVLVLGVAALGFNAAIRRLQLHFQKLPVPLAADSLKQVPAELGPWVQASLDEPLEKDIEETLGATQYIFRVYVDSRLVTADQLKVLRGQQDSNKEEAAKERQKLLADLQMRNPQAVVHLAVNYHTGMVDTVAHIPDRCYIAGGFQPTEYEVRKWNVRDPLNKDGAVQVRYISFEDQTGFVSSIRRNVAYFFRVNGEATCDPLGVRSRLQDLREKYGYYAKIELMSLLQDRDDAAAVLTDFLGFALPAIDRQLPDWQAVNRGGARQ